MLDEPPGTTPEISANMHEPSPLPQVALTMGDVAGIGPEVIVKGWADPRLHALARPLVVGDAGALERACAMLECHRAMKIETVASPEDADPSPGVIPCLCVRRNSRRSG